jgi:regulator of protease activity HflC (stomatin/prohibitin superfamily)
MEQMQQQSDMQAQAQSQQAQQSAQIQSQQAQEEATRQQQAAQAGQAGMPEAIAFIRAILSGQMPELPKSIGPDFIKYLDHFMQSPEAKANGTLLSVLQQFRDQAQLRSPENPATVN